MARWSVIAGLPVVALALAGAGSSGTHAATAPGPGTCNGNANPPNPNGNLESLLANLSPAAGSSVKAGQTISLLYSDETPIAPSSSTITNPMITIGGTSVTATVTPTSGQTPNYLNPQYGGSESTDCQYIISFTIPSGLSKGNNTVDITVYDGDNDHDMASWNYTASTPTPPPPPFVTSEELTPNDEAYIPDSSGTVTFELFPPSDPNCQGTPAYTSGAVTLASDYTATTTNTTFVASTPGTWKWVVKFHGTPQNLTDKCGTEQFIIRSGS
jgi:hypothetical protein